MPQIAIIGEAWGEEEEKERTPFVGASGYLLTRMLEEAGIARADCHLTNVFNLRPVKNDISTLCGPKDEGIKGYPALVKSKYLRAEFASELERLGDELIEVNPNLIIALGNTALWSICGHTAISKSRGTTRLSTHAATGFKVLPTYHPAAVIRDWSLRPIAVIDLLKAARERHYPEIRRPKREVWIEPQIEDLEQFYEQYIVPRSIEQRLLLAVDIETAGFQITNFGFGYTDVAITIPFLDERRKDRNYWPTPQHERSAWQFVHRICADRKIRKTFQNGLYDIAFSWRANGIAMYSAEEDTMLLHHAMHPESLKSLGFLGSIYTDEGSWKDMRKWKTTIKKDD